MFIGGSQYQASNLRGELFRQQVNDTALRLYSSEFLRDVLESDGAISHGKDEEQQEKNAAQERHGSAPEVDGGVSQPTRYSPSDARTFCCRTRR